MKLTLKQLVDSVQALQELQQVPLMAKMSFRLAQVMKEADKHLANFSEQRTRVVESGKDANEVQAEINDLLSIEVDLPDAVIPLEDIAGIALTPATVAALDWLIVE